MELSLAGRARMHAALGEPVRLAIVHRLALTDRSPSDLAQALDLPTNLLSHHLGVLEGAGLVLRSRSAGDKRRTYVRLAHADRFVASLVPMPRVAKHRRVLFICTHNSARSQMAAAAWRKVSDLPAESAGTHPAARVHPRAVAVGRRHGLNLSGAATRHVQDILEPGDLVVAVCDQVHEELDRTDARLHWSVPDPSTLNKNEAFESALQQLTTRINRLAPAFVPAGAA